MRGRARGEGGGMVNQSAGRGTVRRTRLGGRGGGRQRGEGRDGLGWLRFVEQCRTVQCMWYGYGFKVLDRVFSEPPAPAPRTLAHS